MCSTYPPPIPRKKNWEEGDYNWKEKEGKLKGPFWSVMDGGGVGLWTLSRRRKRRGRWWWIYRLEVCEEGRKILPFSPNTGGGKGKGKEGTERRGEDEGQFVTYGLDSMGGERKGGKGGILSTYSFRRRLSLSRFAGQLSPREKSGGG